MCLDNSTAFGPLRRYSFQDWNMVFHRGCLHFYQLDLLIESDGVGASVSLHGAVTAPCRRLQDRYKPTVTNTCTNVTQHQMLNQLTFRLS